MPVRLGGVENHEEEVRALADGYHLPSPSLSLGGALDDSRQIQELNLRVVVMDDARNTSQRCELVRCRLGVRARELRQQRGLSHGGEPNQSNSTWEIRDRNGINVSEGVRELLESIDRDAGRREGDRSIEGSGPISPSLPSP